MNSIIGGTIALIIGLFGIVYLWCEVYDFLLGFFPLAFFVGGIIAIFAGLDLLKKKKPSK